MFEPRDGLVVPGTWTIEHVDEYHIKAIFRDSEGRVRAWEEHATTPHTTWTFPDYIRLTIS